MKRFHVSIFLAQYAISFPPSFSSSSSPLFSCHTGIFNIFHVFFETRIWVETFGILWGGKNKKSGEDKLRVN